MSFRRWGGQHIFVMAIPIHTGTVYRVILVLCWVSSVILSIFQLMQIYSKIDFVSFGYGQSDSFAFYF